MKRNRLYEIPEKDVISGKAGRLYINGYYCECFITCSKKSMYSPWDKFMAADLTITTGRPVWLKETNLEITADSDWKPVSETGIDFPYGFPYDYGATYLRQNAMRNDAFTDSNFRMEIHGPVINPTVTINGHEYQVNVTLLQGQTLVIDSIAQTIMVGDENAFNARGRDSYIFQKIPSGQLDVSWDNTFDIDLYLMEERSEPKWMLGEI
jgi:hypothetical protein